MTAETIEPAAPSAATATRVPRRRETGKRSGPAYTLMAFPAVALFTLFITLPAIVGAILSFTNYAGFGAWKWVGIENYASLFHDSTIMGSYKFTLLFAVVTTLVVNALALFLAIALNSKIHFKRTLRSIFFVPMVLSGIVVAYVFQYIFGFEIPSIFGGQSLLASSHWAWLGVVVVTAWQSIPSAMVIYLAGLVAIPGEVYEAAKMDGATAWRTFRSVTLPLMTGYVIINTVLSFKNYLNVYDVVVGLTGGGPGTATTSVAMGMFNGFNNGDYAYSMANAVIFFIITVVISLLQLRLMKGREVSL